MSFRVSIALIGLLLLVSETAFGQSDAAVRVTAEATPSVVGVDGQVTFEIQIEGAPLSAIEASTPPGATNLVLQDPAPQTDPELSFDEGRLTRRVSIKWRLQPVDVGVGRIDPVTVHVQGEEYSTAEIRVRVVPRGKGEGQQYEMDTRQKRSDRSIASRTSTVQPLRARDVFIRASASADTAYENEQLTLEYRLFFRPGVRLRQSKMADAWDAPGFWREELDVASRPTPRRTTLFGEPYKAIVLKRVALFPTRTGQLRIDPLRIETEARPRPELGRRDAAPRTRYEPVTLSSEALSIRAISLPPEAPSAFQGAVGTFSLDTEVGADSVEVGEGLNLTVRIQGRGNLATLSPPVVEAPSAFEMYESSVEMTVDRSGASVQGTKTFSYTLVPRSNGRYTVPPTTFAYFDPEAESYQTLRSDPVTLRVVGDVAPQARAQTGEGFPLNDLAGPMDEVRKWVSSERPPLYANPWTYAAVLVPVVLAAAAAAYRRMNMNAGTAAPANAPPLELAQQHLRDAHHCLRDGEIRAFYATVQDAVFAYFAARIGNMSRAQFGREALARHLSELDVPRAEYDAVHDLLDACDEAQFTPTEPSYDAMKATLDHAQGLLLRLDEILSDGNLRTSA